MPDRTRFPNDGFTLIELLISLVIMALVLTVGFANFRGFASRQKIEGATREIKADLRLAQQEAVAGKKPVDSSGVPEPECDSASDETLDGYEFRYEGPTSYSIYAVCTGGDVEIKVVDFVEKYPDVEISNFSDFTFEILTQGVSNNRNIVVREFDSGGSEITSRTIEITTGGQIN